MIVLLHGFTGAPRSFDTLRRRLVGPVYVPELIGHGAPARRVDSFEDEVDRIVTLIGAIRGQGPLVVVGYSLGGRLALGLAARHPRSVDAVVAIGAHPGLRDASLRAARRSEDEALAERIEAGGTRAFVEEWEALPLFRSQRELPAGVLAAQRAVRLAGDPMGLARSLRVVGLGRMPDLRPMLEESRVAMHLVTGALDDKFTTLATELQPTSHTIVPRVGHNVLLERPEAIANIVGTLRVSGRGRPAEVRL